LEVCRKDKRLGGEFFDEGILDVLVALKADLATVGGLARDPWSEKPAEMRLAAFFASTSSFSQKISSEVQSLIPGTIIKFSLRVRSGPREFLMGPIGAEMVGRFFLTLTRTLAGVDSRGRDAILLSSPARKDSMALDVEYRVDLLTI
jgi:hypothetical protein